MCNYCGSGSQENKWKLWSTFKQVDGIYVNFETRGSVNHKYFKDSDRLWYAQIE